MSTKDTNPEHPNNDDEAFDSALEKVLNKLAESKTFSLPVCDHEIQVNKLLRIIGGLAYSVMGDETGHLVIPLQAILDVNSHRLEVKVLPSGDVQVVLTPPDQPVKKPTHPSSGNLQ